MIPGSNILNRALTLIARQPFQYMKFMSRTPNAVGQFVSDYSSPYNITGSVQPVPRNLYEQYGLEFQKNYLTFFVEANFLDIARDISGDQILFNGITFNCISRTDWFFIDGWVGIIAAQVKP